MIALAIALAGLSALLTGFVITMGIWMRSDKRELANARDTLDATERASHEWEQKYTEQLHIAKAAMDERESERNRRAIAEAQRNAAEERVFSLLREHMRNATDDEIRELTRDAFATALSIVPLPQAGRAEGADDLLNPFTGV